MKIGVFTFHDVDNYGAILQAYALQQTLKKLGMENEFVDIERDTKPIQKIPTSGPMAVYFKRFTEVSEKRKKLFENFRKDYLDISTTFSKNDIKVLNDKYVFFIVGSDQVWNLRIPDVDPRYFLPFASDDKKYSYAASFGSENVPQKAMSWCSEQLRSFKKISVRETSGQTIIHKITGRDALVHADPTLLLDKDDWEKISEKKEDKYVLLFLIMYDEETVKKAKDMATKYDAELKIVTGSFIPQLGIDANCKTGVSEWITLIRNAQCVITNSFHGVVFSVIFEKNFEWVPLKGNLSSRNGRVEELLEKTGLMTSRNFKNAKSVIECMKSKSIEYLKEIGAKNGII